MTTPSPESFEQARVQLREQIAESHQRRAALRETAASVRGATGSARSRDGSISVTASADGSITDITLTDDALEDDATNLANELKVTVTAAQRAALEQAAAVSGAGLGDDHPLVADLRRSAERFAGPEDQLKYQ